MRNNVYKCIMGNWAETNLCQLVLILTQCNSDLFLNEMNVVENEILVHLIITCTFFVYLFVYLFGSYLPIYCILLLLLLLLFFFFASLFFFILNPINKDSQNISKKLLWQPFPASDLWGVNTPQGFPSAPLYTEVCI